MEIIVKRRNALFVTSWLLVILMMGGAAQAGNQADLKVLGKTYGEWSTNWWKWVESRDYSPLTESGPVDCSEGQQGPVWFLAGTDGSASVERTCTVRNGVGLFFPLVNAEYTNEPGDNSTVADKRFILDAYLTGNDPSTLPLRACNMQSTVDDVPILSSGFTIVRTQSPPFPYTQRTDHGDFFDPETVSDGYWAMLFLPRGPHKLTIKGAICDVPGNIAIFNVDVTYHLTVK